MPAQLTSASSDPSAATMRSMAGAIVRSSVTSPVTAIDFAPEPSIRRAVSAAAAPSRSRQPTATPSPAKNSAAARPMPLPAPTTIAVYGRFFDRPESILEASSQPKTRSALAQVEGQGNPDPIASIDSDG